MSPSSKGLCINLKNQTDLSVGVTYITRLQVPLFPPYAGAGSACLLLSWKPPLWTQHRRPHVSTFSLLFWINRKGRQGLVALVGGLGLWVRPQLQMARPPATSVSHSTSPELFDWDLTAGRERRFCFLRLCRQPLPPLGDLIKPRGTHWERMRTGTPFSTFFKLTWGREAGFYSKKYSASRKAHLLLPKCLTSIGLLMEHPLETENKLLPYYSLGNFSGDCLNIIA